MALRLFLAVQFDRGLRRALHATSQELAPTLDRGLRWIAEEQLHLTLRFVGETADSRITEVIEAAEEAASGVAPFAIQVRGLGCFPKAAAARVVWAGIEPCRPLDLLARALEKAIRDRGFAPERRGFTGHVTLARARGAPVRLAAPLDPEAPRFGEQEVAEIAVMESRLSRSGSAYVQVAGVPLDRMGEVGP